MPCHSEPMTARDAIEVVRRALHRFDSSGLHGLAENADESLAVLTNLVERAGEPVSDAARPMDTYVSGLALLWMPEFDHYAAGWWKGSVISGITRLQTPLVQDDKQLWLEMTDMQPLGWMPLPAAPGASHER